MSQILSPGELVFLPKSVQLNNLGLAYSTTLNATGETQVFSGQILLENPEGGSKTISAAGGGMIVWRTGTVTFANAGTTFTVGIQDLNATASPPQGDGTFDVSKTHTGGDGSITSNAVITSTMSSGTKTISHGDFIGIVFEMTARGGADSVTSVYNNQDVFMGLDVRFPRTTSNTTGSYTSNSAGTPNAYIVFDDGTVGQFFGSTFRSESSSVTYNSGTGTADEYGNVINSVGTFKALGVYGNWTTTTSSATQELLLYSDPFGTPVAERTLTFNPYFSTSTGGRHILLFTSPFLLKANTNYAVTLRPTATVNVSLEYVGIDNVRLANIQAPTSRDYAVRRLDNSGAFSDYNGGTAKTRQMCLHLVGSYVEQGVNICNGQVGVY